MMAHGDAKRAVEKLLKGLGGFSVLLPELIDMVSLNENDERDKNKRRYLTRLRLDLENALFNYERRYIEEELVQKAVDEVRENFDVKWKE